MKRKNLLTLAIGILVLGSLWGMSEVALGGALRIAEFPYRSGLLTGIGMAIIGMAWANSKEPLMPVGIGVVSAMVNQLAVPLLGVSLMCKANSCLAIVIEAASLGIVATVLMRKTSNVYTRMGTGAFAALLASVGFFCIGPHVAPCNYLLSFPHLGAFVVKEGLVWAAFAGILFPFGYLVGEKLSLKLPVLVQKGGLFYYGAAGLLTVFWGVSAMAIVSGL